MKSAAVNGEYKGKPSSPDSVKKTVDFQGLKIRLDRPKGFVMRGRDKDGNDWERVYQYDYGFLPKTQGGDGDGVDVFIGPHKESDESYWVTQVKEDGTFDEYKVFVGFTSAKDAKEAYKAHIPPKLMGPVVTMKIPLMRAMLGIDPEPKLGSISISSFARELYKMAVEP